jgi:VanZ family protein
MNRNFQMKELHWRLLCCLWVVTILVLSLMPARNVPVVGVWNADKLVHTGMYFALALLMLKSHWLPIASLKYLLVVALVCIGFGASIEWLQEHCTTDRHFDDLDIVANTLGVVLFLFAKRFVKLV